MLIGSSMEYVLRTELVEDSVHSRLAANSGDHHMHIDVGELLGHHQPQVVLGCLCLVDQHHSGRLTGGNLSDHLRTNRASRASDEDATTIEQLAHRLHIDLDFGTRQKVFNRHLLQLYLSYFRLLIFFAKFLDLDSVLSHENLHAQANQQVLQLLVLTEVVRTIRRHEHGTDMIIFNHLPQVVLHRKHLLADKFIMAQATVMGDEALQYETTLCTNALCQSDATTLCSVDQYTQGIIIGRRHIVDCLHQHTHGPHGHGGNHIHQDDLASRQRFEILARGREHEIVDTQSKR